VRGEVWEEWDEGEKWRGREWEKGRWSDGVMNRRDWERERMGEWVTRSIGTVQLF